MKKAMHGFIPVPLMILALLFLAGGVFAAVWTAGREGGGWVPMDLGMVGIPIGIGLLLRSRIARFFALVLTALGLLGVVSASLFLSYHRGEIDASIFGQGEGEGEVPKEAAFIVLAVIFACLVWQFRVLTRRRVLRFFRSKEDRAVSRSIRRGHLKKFFLMHPEYRDAEPHLQREAFRRWLGQPLQRRAKVRLIADDAESTTSDGGLTS